jgi:proline racemase
MTDARRIRVVDMHSAGEPVRIVEKGFPELRGANILEKRRDALQRFDGLRRTLMLEPRGHSGMYGVIPTRPSDARADLAVLFMHQEGYSTMCGHATIAIGRWALDSGRIASPANGVTRFMLEVPCGLVSVEVAPGATEDAPLVSFDSVPSFASQLNEKVMVEGIGEVRFDIAFGGAYYAILPASRIGRRFGTTPLGELIACGAAITQAVRASMAIRHPEEPELGFLYGTIITDDVPLGASGEAPSSNLCIFADGQIDRSPTGSGVTARIALAAARGDMRPGDRCKIRGVSGQAFTGELLPHQDDRSRFRVRVSGRAYYIARSEFLAERSDPFADGFVLPPHFADLEERGAS